MNAPNTVSYRYGIPAANRVIGFVVGSLMTIASIYGLVTRSPLSFRSSSLDADEAWIGWITLLIGGLLILGVALGYHLLSSNQQVELGPGRLHAPAGDLTRNTVTIDPRSVTEVKLKRSRRLPQANIRHAEGVLKLKGDFFERPEAFEHFLTNLELYRSN